MFLGFNSKKFINNTSILIIDKLIALFYAYYKANKSLTVISVDAFYKEYKDALSFIIYNSKDYN